ncbi:MAG: hypothetical protein AAF573_17650 [Bacteroidota bacterium]
MISLKNIFLQVLFIGCFAFVAQGQAATKSAEAEYQTLERSFELEKVSKPQLNIFQKKSIQMVKDLVSTLELSVHPNFDKRFKKKLKEQALNYFTHPTDSLFFLNENKLSGLTIENLLNNERRIQTYFSNCEASGFDVTSPNFSNEKYTWQVTFQLKNRSNIQRTFLATYVLAKEAKSFGGNDKEVWNVALVSIKEQKD